MKTILVSGGAGYIGSHTVLDLIKKGFNPIIVDDFSNSSRKVITILEELAGVKIPFYELDVKNKEGLRKIFSKNKIDAVINFAGFKAVGESVEKPLMYYENNLFGMITLLEVMKEFDVKNIVFSSSATVYGISDKVPFVETDPMGEATNPYGRTKVMIENILMDLAKSDKTWNIIALRYFNPLGAHESGRIGEDSNGIPNNLSPYITQVAVGKLDKLHIFGNDYDTPDGTCIRDFVHINDLAAGHSAAINYLFNGNVGFEAINLGSEKGYSVLEILHNFEKAAGKTIPYVIEGRRVGDIAICYADASKAKKLLNWEAKYTIEDMCRDSWNWQKKNPNGFED